ncbi:MAG: integrase arm-type DNA-binding domain-containing protein, partial [Hyphomicrobiaceae bacterium]
MRRNLTDATIKTLPFGEKKYNVWDLNLPTFGVRVTKSTRTFVLKKDNRYHTLGRWPAVSLKQAREEAKRRLALKYFPQPTTAPPDAIDQYLEHQKSRIRPGSFIRFRLHLLRDFPKKRLENVTSNDLHDAIKHLSPSQANLAFTVFKVFLNHCVQRDYIAKYPLQGAKLPHKVVTRDRVL